MNTDIASNRHRGNIQSELAFQQATKSGKIDTDRRKVLEAVIDSGARGLTCKELASRWGVVMNNLSGRFSELKRDNKIKQQGRRENSGVCFPVGYHIW